VGAINLIKSINPFTQDKGMKMRERRKRIAPLLILARPNQPVSLFARFVYKVVYTQRGFVTFSLARHRR